MTATLPTYLLREYRRMLALLLVLTVAAVAVWSYLLVPQRQRREQLQERWSEKRQQLHAVSQGLTPEFYRRTRRNLDSLLATVPARSEFPRVLGQVTDYAALHGATIKTLTYRQLPPAIEGVTGYTLSIGVTGSYGAVKQVLAELQSLGALAYVETVSLVNPDPLKEHLLLDVRMVLHLRSERSP